ncbi:ATP-binding protein, partial [Escherichia coli]|nr:ATP-binding protein [Escherichia coli]
TLIEPSKRAGEPESLSVLLPYSSTPFSVPNNLYLIGTMNTADHSLTALDTALRRRFDFEAMLPDITVLKDTVIKGIDLPRLLQTLN